MRQSKTEHRKKGAASALIQHIYTQPEYKNYILEVADTNTNAVALYKKLGFKEVYRKALHTGKKYAGLNALVYMYYTKA